MPTRQDVLHVPELARADRPRPRVLGAGSRRRDRGGSPSPLAGRRLGGLPLADRERPAPPGPDLLGRAPARRDVDYLVLGEAWEDASGSSCSSTTPSSPWSAARPPRHWPRSARCWRRPGSRPCAAGVIRARYVEAAALDALGDAGATSASTALLESGPDSATALKAATALCRIWREQGQLERAHRLRPAPRWTPCRRRSGRHRGGHPALGHPGRGPVHRGPDRGGGRALRPGDRASPSGSARPWPAPRPTGTPACIRSEAGDMAEALRLAQAGLAPAREHRAGPRHRPAAQPARLDHAAQSDPPRLAEDARSSSRSGRRRARLERGQPGRPGPQRDPA